MSKNILYTPDTFPHIFLENILLSVLMCLYIIYLSLTRSSLLDLSNSYIALCGIVLRVLVFIVLYVDSVNVGCLML